MGGFKVRVRVRIRVRVRVRVTVEFADGACLAHEIAPARPWGRPRTALAFIGRATPRSSRRGGSGLGSGLRVSGHRRFPSPNFRLNLRPGAPWGATRAPPTLIEGIDCDAFSG